MGLASVTISTHFPKWKIYNEVVYNPNLSPCISRGDISLPGTCKLNRLKNIEATDMLLTEDKLMNEYNFNIMIIHDNRVDRKIEY